MIVASQACPLRNQFRWILKIQVQILVQILFLLFQGSCIPDTENKLQEDISTESHLKENIFTEVRSIILRFCLFRNSDLTIQFQEPVHTNTEANSQNTSPKMWIRCSPPPLNDVFWCVKFDGTSTFFLKKGLCFREVVFLILKTNFRKTLARKLT